MADELGTAVLTLVIDQEAFKKSLNQAKAQLKSELGDVTGAGGQRRPAGGQRTGTSAELRASAQILRLRNSINILEANGVNVSRLRARLTDLEAAAESKKYRVVRQQGEALRQTISVEQNRLRVNTLNTRQLERQRREQLRIAKENALPVTGVVKTPGLPPFQYPGSPGRFGGGGGGGNPPSGPRDPNRAAREAAREEERLSRARRRGALIAEKTAEQEVQARRKLTKEIAANALIGAGFPLLFGQGVGAAAGGGLGGALGALGGGTFGFAGSIAGTALGAAFDTTLQKAQTLAQGLQTPIASFDALKEASLLSSKSVEKQAEALIAVGRNAEAAVVIQSDLQKTFGDAASAQQYLRAVDDLNRAWSQASTLLGAFVAGPLAKFLEGISRRVQPTPPPDIRAERRRQGSLLSDAGFGVTALSLGLAATPFAPAALPGLAVGGSLVGIGSAFSAGGDEAKAAEQAAAAAKIEQQQAAKINELRKATKKELSDSYKLITATVQGDRAALELAQKQAIINEKNAALRNLAADGVTSSADARVAAVNEQAAKKLFDLKEQQLQKDREIQATQYLQVTQTELQLQAVRERITAAQQLAGAERGVTRETLRGIIAVQQGINESRRREKDLGAQISAARISGAEPQDIETLVRQQQVAATETRARLFEGALALQEAGEKLRDDVRDSALNLAKVRGGEQGLNRFLSTGLQQQRAEQTNRLLQPFFQEAVGRLRQLVPTADISGFALTGATTADLNKNIIDFIQAVNEEFNATQNFANAQQSLQQVNQALVDINSQLVGATNALAAKDWVVAVNVVNQAGGASTINTVNSLS